MIYVLVETVDEKGVANPLDDRTFSDELSGPAELLGIDAGNPMGFETITDADCALFFGKAVVVLGSRPGDGKIVLKATADGVKSAEVVLGATDL